MTEAGKGRSDLALVLGGGGGRGFAHIGVLQFLEENEIQVDMVVGTSMGAVMGAALAADVDLEKLTKILIHLDINKLLKISPTSRREVEKLIGKSLAEQLTPPVWKREEPDQYPTKLSRMYRFFQLFTKGYTIEELPLPYAAVATDMGNGEEVVLKEGKLYKAVTASSAIPGFIPPVARNGRLLIDGGVVDRVPINVAIDMGARSVLAVDVSGKLTSTPKTSIEVAIRADSITSRELVRVKNQIARKRLDGKLVIVRPRVQDLNWLSLNNIEEASTRGFEAMKKRSTRVTKLVEY
ncbi:MAG: patatin-like phospholipase family protein [Candidatus Bipolaricaulota bacterium]